MSELVVPARFRGPARSGNGGWSAGALAALAPWPVVTVRLSAPPPLDTQMEVTEDGADLVASYDGTEVLRASAADHEPEPVAPVDLETARAAAAAYPGLTSHPFPTCFSCGTGREDGLRIFPGPLGEGRVAAPWTPDASLAADWHEYTDATREVGHAVTWAALDCSGAWASDVGERLMVLGSMTARLSSLPVVGADHVVVGEARGGSGRKSLSATSVYTADGTLVGTAEHVWIAVDPAAFN